MAIELTVEEDQIAGDLWVAVPAGTRARARESLLASALGEPIDALARALSVILTAPLSAYAHEQPGRDEAGRTLFKIRARLEGDRMLPVKLVQKGRKHAHPGGDGEAVDTDQEDDPI